MSRQATGDDDAVWSALIRIRQSAVRRVGPSGINENSREAILRLLHVANSPVSLVDIAEVSGFSYSCVYRHLSFPVALQGCVIRVTFSGALAYTLTDFGRAVAQILSKRLKYAKLYENGASVQDVAYMAGISRSNMRRALIEADVVFRTHSQARVAWWTVRRYRNP